MWKMIRNRLLLTALVGLSLTLQAQVFYGPSTASSQVGGPILGPIAYPAQADTLVMTSTAANSANVYSVLLQVSGKQTGPWTTCITETVTGSSATSTVTSSCKPTGGLFYRVFIQSGAPVVVNLVDSNGAPFVLSSPRGVTYDANHNIAYISDSGNNRIIAYNLTTNVSSVLSPTGGYPTVGLSNPGQLGIFSTTDIYIADTGNNRILDYNIAAATVSLKDTTTSGFTLSSPDGVCADGSNVIHIVDTGNNRILDYNTSTSVTTLEAIGTPGGVTLNSPHGCNTNGSGTIWYADTGNNRVVLNAAGTISVVSTSPYTQTMNQGVTHYNPTNQVLMADTGSSRILDLDQGGGVTSILSIYNQPGQIQLKTPDEIYVQGVAGFAQLFIADTGNNRIVQSAFPNTGGTITVGVFGFNSLFAGGGGGTPFVCDEANNCAALDGTNNFTNLQTLNVSQLISVEDSTGSLGTNGWFLKTNGSHALWAAVPPSAAFPGTNGVVCNTSTSASINCPSSEIQSALGSVYALGSNTVNGKPISTNPVLTTLDIGGAGGAVVGGTSLYANTTTQVGTGFNSWQSRVPFVPPATNDCYQISWMNAYQTAETPGPALTINSASIEYPAGTYYPLFFNGSRTGTLAPGAILVSDPNCIDTTAKGVLYVRTLMQRTNPADTTLLPYNYAPGGGLTGTTILAPNVADSTGTFDGGEQIKVGTYADGVANATTTFTSATANFNSSYVGNSLIDARGPTTYTIATFVNSTTVTLSGSPAAGTGLTFSTAAVDKTTSGTINHGTLMQLLAPYALLGQPNIVKNVGFVGDSITWGTGAPLIQSNGVSGINGYIGSWATQAVSQANLAAGLATELMPNIAFTNVSMPTETCANFIVHHQTRFALLGRARKTMGDLGINDLVTGGVSANTLENCMLTLWSQFARRGIAPYYSTLTPQTSSTDQWLTAGNQTVGTAETHRVSFNNWMRDGAPLDCATGLAAATGSALTTVVRTNWYANGSLVTPAAAGVAATCSHPAIAGGTFELANAVEVNSSNTLTQNGGFYRADPGARVLTGCSSAASSAPTIVTCTSGTFTSGDVGRLISYAATGTSAVTTISAFTSANIVSINATTTSSPTGITMTVDGAVESQTGGRYNNGDGIHPSFHGHGVMGIMAAAAPVAQWTF